MSAKLMRIEEVIAHIPDGAKLAISGNMEMSPMALIRAIVRAQRRDLYVVCTGAAAVNADLLIGAGAVSTVEFSQISMGEFGFALNFRRSFEQRAIVGLEHACPTLTAAIGAGASGIPFTPVRGLIGTDYMTIRRDFHIIPNPYAPAEHIAVVPAIRPHVAIFHGYKADTLGNVVAHPAQNNRLLAQASVKTFASVEEIVSPEQLQKEQGAFISSMFISGVVQVPGGALPTSCPGYYDLDVDAILAYMEAAASQSTWDVYLEGLRREGV
ncbi:CoA transferase subunit A [Paenibacillus roseipurpureus]|uniref:CoA-transferase n=1 Tax=Paenibacillus roseopurpureus TaxID=2918901 RepID=A0AA96LL35_9BACL|nr:CoA-transferase [Paenibacillus sp. MBLB1832]WNR43092.1 CoA-transferase [Paenibacillus sp. MBLB1832]